MAQRYIKVFYDWLDVTAAFTTEEKGQLIDAMVSYAAGKPYEVSGRVAIMFPALKAQIDRDNESYQKQVDGGQYGKLGGRPKNPKGYEKTPRVAPKPPETQDKEKDKEKEKEKDNDKDNIYADAPSSPSYDDNPFSEEHEPTPSFDTIQVYATNSLRALSDGNLKHLNTYVEEMGEELVRYAIDTACANGAPYWRYTEGILVRLKEEGITTVADAKAADEKFRHSRDKPDDGGDDEGGGKWFWANR